MHQPGYLNLEETELELPWVRLHSAKAYFDMAWLLERHPNIKCTINFVPILLEQISHYLEGMRDSYFKLTMKPTTQLTHDEKAIMVAKFFSCHFDTCVATRPRFHDLYLKARSQDPGETWSNQDYLDLAVLFNLSWFGYGARVEYPLIEALEAKGQNYSEDDKRKVLDVQLAVMRRLYPMYRKLRKRGQVEISTTPYHHPILPLLIDSECMQRCMPEADRPTPFQFPDDAKRHVTLAMENYQAIFGEPPQGIWPAEGSVSPEAIELFESANLAWAVTDEAQLWKSLGDRAHNRGQLYRPYQLSENGISLFFRDRDLSDAVGFRYARMSTEEAVQSCLGQVKSSSAQAMDQASPLVVIALDGENPWEYYPNNGRDFLESLYTSIEQDPTLDTVRLQDACNDPDIPSLDSFATGSWIEGNFAVWIGGATENKAWQLLGETRRTFESVRSGLPATTEARAERMLMRAQSSDWFWWYGDRFASADDADFDQLFRGLLRGAYETMQCPVPPSVDVPLVLTAPKHDIQNPKGLLSPDFGLPTTAPVSWADAGICVPSAGSMALGERFFGETRFGFDTTKLYFRIERHASENAVTPGELELFVNSQHTVTIPVDPIGTLPTEAHKRFARNSDTTIEGYVALDTLENLAGETIDLCFTVTCENEISERVPLLGSIQTQVPDHNFGAKHWSV